MTHVVGFVSVFSLTQYFYSSLREKNGVNVMHLYFEFIYASA